MPRFAIIAADGTTVRQTIICSEQDAGLQKLKAGEKMVPLAGAHEWVTSKKAVFDPANQTFTQRPD